MKKYLIAAAFTFLLITPPAVSFAQTSLAAADIARTNVVQQFESQLTSLQTALSSLNAAPEGQLTSAIATSTYYFSYPMGHGSRGYEVTQLQKVLVADGYLPSDDISGYFGNLTEKAVKQYQTAHGIEATGYVGKQTLRALNATVVVVPPPPILPPPVSTTTPPVATGTPPVATPTVTLTATASTITSGNSTTLAWSSANATSCTATGFSISSGLTTGSVAVSPTTTTTYSVSCTGAGGTGSASATVTVTPASPTVTVPGAPTGVSATAGNAQATISFAAPASNGGSAITSYTVASNSGKTATGSASPITVTGLTNGTVYTFTVTATNAKGTSAESSVSNSVTPVLSTTPPPTTPTPPSQASTVGFTNLVFDDEFTSASTITTSTSASTGYKWYPFEWGVATAGDVSVNTGTVYAVNGNLTTTAPVAPTAAQTATGVVTISNGGNIDTVPTYPTISGSNTAIPGTYSHAYFEARIQVSPKNPGNGTWPGFWSFGSSAYANVTAAQWLTGQTAENDFIEWYPDGSGFDAINTMHNWQHGSNAVTGNDTYNTDSQNYMTSLVGSTESAQPTDGEWHTYGCLWVQTSATTGYVEYYLDNHLVAHQNGVTRFLTGTGTGLTQLELDNMYVILGGATNWPINVDWVHIWQSSNPSSPIPPTTTVPGAPTSVTATAGNAQATVSFVAPSSNGGAAITGYTVTSSSGQTATGSASPITITGLANGTAYTFTVKATNSAGQSVASVASNSVTPVSPTATTFTFTGPSSGNVNTVSTSFIVTPKSTYNGTITITPSGAGSTGLSAKVLTFSGTTAQTFTITPTTVGSITLTSTNNGSLVNPSNLIYTVNAVVPGAPTGVSATAGNAQATVSFTAPASNGGAAITGYTVTSSSGQTATGSASPLTVIGLTNGNSYTFTITATNVKGTSAASSASNSVTPTGGTTTGGGGTVTPPPQATAANFTNLVFNDDFTNANTFAPTSAPTATSKWYRYGNAVANDVTINTGAGTGTTAGATGVLTIDNTPVSWNQVIQTVPGNATAATTAGTFHHGYFEARMQFSPTVQGSGGTSGGWPSFWMWDARALSPFAGQLTAEDDILEAWPNGTAGATDYPISTLHNWDNTSSDGGSDIYNTGNNNAMVSPAAPTDSGWHTYGCLWVQTSATAGYVEFYLDNHLIVHQGGVTRFLTGTGQSLSPGQISNGVMGTSLSALETAPMFLILGTAKNWPLNVDWVHVWQQ